MFLFENRSRGFVLEGFPSNENETNYLIEKGYFADAAISLNASDDSIIKRLLPPRVDRWKEKVRQRQERRNKKKEEKRKELVGLIKTLKLIIEINFEKLKNKIIG